MTRIVDQLEQQMILRINKGYGALVKEINESFTRILQLAIGSSEELQKSLSLEVEEAKKQMQNTTTPNDQPSKSLIQSNVVNPSKMYSLHYNNEPSLEEAYYTMQEPEQQKEFFQSRNNLGPSRIGAMIKEEQSVAMEEMVRKKKPKQNFHSKSTKNVKHNTKTIHLSEVKNTNETLETVTVSLSTPTEAVKEEIAPKITKKARRSKKRKSNSKDEQVNCDFCDAVFTRKDNARRHLRVRHGKLQDLKCNECDFATHSQDALKLHSIKH